MSTVFRKGLGAQECKCNPSAPIKNIIQILVFIGIANQFENIFNESVFIINKKLINYIKYYNLHYYSWNQY